MKAPKRMFSLSEICHDTNLSTNQVIGALRGIKNDYGPELSLMSLGLVREVLLKTSTGRSRKVYVLNNEREIPFDRIEHILARFRRMGEE
jgi:predicted transcriptional regulator with HTH domain